MKIWRVKHTCTLFICLFVLTITIKADAQSFVPSPKQVEQFKNLPRAQQEALARQLGFDISVLDGLNNRGTQSERDNAEANLSKVDRVVDEKSISEQLSRQTIASEATKELKPFGYNLFNSSDNNFGQPQNMPIPQDYVLGIGDELVLRLFGKESGNFTLEVSNEGVVDIPELGPMMVAGLSFQEAKKAISEKYNQQKIGVEPFVSMGQIRTIQVYMVGEVFQPGSLNVSSLSTVSTALFAGGGVSEIGSLRNIEVKRAGKTVAQFDLYDLLVNGDVSDDIRLQQGDVIFVPVVNRVVSIDGQVRRPAIYELKKDESLSKLVSLAGGLLPSADDSAIQLVRNSAQEGLVIKTINYNSEQQKDVGLVAGDFVNVIEASLEFSTAIRVQGAINSPRLLSVNQKQSIADLVTSKSLLKRTDLEYALVLRKPKFSEQSEVIQFQPRDVIFGRYDLKLEPFDQVFFFDRFISQDDKKSGADGQAKEVVEADILSAGDQSSLDSDSKLLGKESLQQFTRKDLIQNEEESDNSRKSLLASVIAQLRNEANEKSPVKLVEVTGQVKFPGIYPLASNNSSVAAVIRAAGGLTEAAHLASVEISRFGVQNGSVDVQHKQLSLLNELALDEAKQQQLVSKDVLNIPRIPDWFENEVIELRGEFVFPGRYQIRRGETLESVIQRAGGLTSKASIEAAVFTRQELKKKEQENIDKAIEDLRQQLANNNLSNSQFSRTIDYENATKVLDDLSAFQPVGRLVIDLDAIVEGEQSRNIELKSGDILYVPNITPAISVIGEVFVPTTHWYSDNMKVEDYVKLSGGTREYADDSKIYIVRADGSVVIPDSGAYWFGGDTKSILRPGDTIVVPRDVTNYDNISLWQGVTQIIYQTAVALAAIGSL